MNPVYGWQKDKFDSHDLIHRTMGAAEIPRRVMLDNLLPPVRDQGPHQSCVGHGIGAALCGELAALGIYTEWTSPQYIWNGARFVEGTLTQDVGVEPGDGWDWTFKKGILLEHFWPYNLVLDQSAPSSVRLSEAVKYPAFSYIRCVDGVQGICSALASGHLVAIGAPWFKKWENPPATGILDVVSAADALAGGHETVLAGYDQDEGMFYGQNSWSSSWGDAGKYKMPFEAIDVFKQLGGYDAQFCSFSIQPGPAPAPQPTPSTCPIGNTAAKVLSFVPAILGRDGRFYYLNPRK